jgi:hypothetical protein
MAAEYRRAMNRAPVRGERDAVSAHAIFPTVAVTDTSRLVEAKHFELYRTLSPSERVQIAVNLSEAVRQTVVAGIRRRNPEYTDADVAEALRRMLYASESANR